MKVIYNQSIESISGKCGQWVFCSVKNKNRIKNIYNNSAKTIYYNGIIRQKSISNNTPTNLLSKFKRDNINIAFKIIAKLWSSIKLELTSSTDVNILSQYKEFNNKWTLFYNNKSSKNLSGNQTTEINSIKKIDNISIYNIFISTFMSYYISMLTNNTTPKNIVCPAPYIVNCVPENIENYKIKFIADNSYSVNTRINRFI